jgi:hypothetical protein
MDLRTRCRTRLLLNQFSLTSYSAVVLVNIKWSQSEALSKETESNFALFASNVANWSKRSNLASKSGLSHTDWNIGFCVKTFSRHADFTLIFDNFWDISYYKKILQISFYAVVYGASLAHSEQAASPTAFITHTPIKCNMSLTPIFQGFYPYYTSFFTIIPPLSKVFYTEGGWQLIPTIRFVIKSNFVIWKIFLNRSL